MDTTSRKLVRRARMRRNHERQARAAATKSKRRSQHHFESAAPQWELFGAKEWQDAAHSTRSSNVPSLPALSDSQYMITSNESSSQYGGGPPDKVMKVATPFPSKERLYQGERRPQRQGRSRKVVDYTADCMSDSNVPTTTHWRSRDLGEGSESGNFSDTAVLHQQRHQGQQESRRIHRRREGRRKNTFKNNHVNSDRIIETVLEENITQEATNPVEANPVDNKKNKILPEIPSNPPSPTLSRMVKRKTEKMNISDNVLHEIKEMSSHLRIVNWLWDSTRMPLKKTGAKTYHGGISPCSTTTSSNLVVVRGASEANWFDMPRVVRQEQLSPISVDSDLKSDYEEELMHLL